MQARGTTDRFGRIAVKGVLSTASGICLMLALVVDPGAAQMRAAEGSIRAVSVPPLADSVPFDSGDDGNSGSPTEN